MFKRDLSWVDDHIKNSDNSGRPLTAAAFEECKKIIQELEEKLQKTQLELRKYKKR